MFPPLLPYMQVDASIIEACVNGERKAQFELYKACYAPMLKICLRYHRNNEDARALVNQAFLKVCENIRRYKKEVPFEYWIKRITINTVIDDYRKNRKKKEHFDAQDMNERYWEARMTDINLGENEMNAESLRALIRMLPPVSQQVFNLCVLDGYDYSEVSKMLGITDATCRWHVHFSRKKLQELIKKTFQQMHSLLL